MADDLMPFNNGEFELEITPDGDSFKVRAPGVARSLGFREAFDLLRNIPDGEKGSEPVRTPGGDQKIGYLTEAGFYRALGQRQSARIADAAVRASVERFQSWVYGEVLPSLRRAQLAPVPSLSRRDLARMVLEEADRADAAEARVAELEPMADAYSHFLESDGTFKWAIAAEILGVGPNLLGEYLRKHGYTRTDEYLNDQGQKRTGEQHNRPYAGYVAWFHFPPYQESERLRGVPEHRQFDRRVTKVGLDSLHRLLRRHVRECGTCGLCGSLRKNKPERFTDFRKPPRGRTPHQLGA